MTSHDGMTSEPRLSDREMRPTVSFGHAAAVLSPSALEQRNPESRVGGSCRVHRPGQAEAPERSPLPIQLSGARGYHGTDGVNERTAMGTLLPEVVHTILGNPDGYGAEELMSIISRAAEPAVSTIDAATTEVALWMALRDPAVLCLPRAIGENAKRLGDGVLRHGANELGRIAASFSKKASTFPPTRSTAASDLLSIGAFAHTVNLALHSVQTRTGHPKWLLADMDALRPPMNRLTVACFRELCRQGIAHESGTAAKYACDLAAEGEMARESFLNVLSELPEPMVMQFLGGVALNDSLRCHLLKAFPFLEGSLKLKRRQRKPTEPDPAERPMADELGGSVCNELRAFLRAFNIINQMSLTSPLIAYLSANDEDRDDLAGSWASAVVDRLVDTEYAVRRKLRAVRRATLLSEAKPVSRFLAKGMQEVLAKKRGATEAAKRLDELLARAAGEASRASFERAGPAFEELRAFPAREELLGICNSCKDRITKLRDLITEWSRTARADASTYGEATRGAELVKKLTVMEKMVVAEGLLPRLEGLQQGLAPNESVIDWLLQFSDGARIQDGVTALWALSRRIDTTPALRGEAWLGLLALGVVDESAEVFKQLTPEMQFVVCKRVVEFERLEDRERTSLSRAREQLGAGLRAQMLETPLKPKGPERG
jgi:hypothetical protein